MEVVVVTALDMRAAGGRALAQTLVVGKGTVALTPKQQRHRQRHQRVGGESAVPMAAVAGAVAEGVRKHRCQLEPVGDVAEGEGDEVLRGIGMINRLVAKAMPDLKYTSIQNNRGIRSCLHADGAFVGTSAFCELGPFWGGGVWQSWRTSTVIRPRHVPLGTEPAQVPRAGLPCSPVPRVPLYCLVPSGTHLRLPCR